MPNISSDHDSYSLEVSELAGADLTAEANLFKFMVLDVNSKAVIAGAGALPIGVLTSRGDVDQGVGIARPGSRVRVRYGAALTAGTQLVIDANGDVIDEANGNVGDWIIGTARVDGSAGALCTIYFDILGQKA